MHWFHILIIIAIAVMTEGSNNTEEYTTVDCLNAVIDTIKIKENLMNVLKITQMNNQKSHRLENVILSSILLDYLAELVLIFNVSWKIRTN